jgi:outer membrane lipopolysaccharide assembly protein LptE/RlpB
MHSHLSKIFKSLCSFSLLSEESDLSSSLQVQDVSCGAQQVSAVQYQDREAEMLLFWTMQEDILYIMERRWLQHQVQVHKCYFTTLNCIFQCST